MSEDREISYQELAEAEIATRAVVEGDIVFDLTAEVAEPPPRLVGEPMVVVSARVPTSTYLRIREAGEARGVAPSVIIREWLELQQAGQEPDRPILLADAIRALASVRPAA